MSYQILARTPRRVSVSTWALHPLLGTVAPGRPGDPEARLMTPQDGDGKTDLLQVPALLAERGIRTMEVCHFHIPTRDEAYLNDLRAAAESAGVEIWQLLIDDGDITDPVHADRDRQWIEGWIDIAAQIGARCVRIIAGKQPTTPETLQRSREQLTQLVIYAYLRGVHVQTENWFALLSTPDAVHSLLDSLSHSVGLVLDFGNWGGSDKPEKYDKLAAIAERATSSHAKCDFKDGEPQVEDFRRCLDLTLSVDFSGPYTLVYGEPGAVWESIARQQEIVAPYCE